MTEPGRIPPVGPRSMGVEPSVMLPSMNTPVNAMPDSVANFFNPWITPAYGPGAGFGSPMGMGGMGMGYPGGMGMGYYPPMAGMDTDTSNTVVPMYGNRLQLDRERSIHYVSHSASKGENTGLVRGTAIGAGVGLASGVGVAALTGARIGSAGGLWGALAGTIIGGVVGMLAGGSIGKAASEYHAVMDDFSDNGHLDGSNHGYQIRYH
ncbi:MAG: complement resistance protein TraT [Cyanobacteria bacterium]|nr:complement resistance protein TraT [Cyanobacteriota bacterium]